MRAQLHEQEMERYEALPSLPPRGQGTRAGAAIIPNAKMLETYEDMTTPNDYEPLDHVNPVFRAYEDEDGVPDDVKPPSRGKQPLDAKPSSSQESGPTDASKPTASLSPEVAQPDAQDGATKPASTENEDSEDETNEVKVDLSEL